MIKKYSQSILLLLATVVLISLFSCNPARKYEKDEKDAINNYLSSNPTMEFVKEPSGLYYLDVAPGTGATPAVHDTAYVRYTGKFLNGTVFDSNTDAARTDFVFPVGEGFAIYGFDEGVSYMKAGGKSTLLVPSSLAYGTQGYYTIPGYTPLLFDIELVKVTAGPAK
jgi:FKBP-type peptidyl-prolyl cis-trans isomerase FkpA